MATEITLSIIKPDATAAGNAGAIIQHLEEAGLRVRAAKMIQLSEAQAKAFYEVHAARPFYGSLVEFMTEGPVWVLILEGEDAVARYRETMGATNPEQAAQGTLRKLYATNIERNACHGSDSVENAIIETNFFFSRSERPWLTAFGG